MDWDRIESEFKELRALLEEMPAPPSQRELETHRVRTKLRLPGSLPAQLDLNYRSYYGSATTKERLDQLKNDIETGGHPECFGGSSLLENCFVTIQESIATKQCSTDFVLAWGYLNQLFGRYAELMEQEDGERKDFERNERAGGSSDTIVHRYWHAHWVVANSKADFRDRREVEAELAELCADVWQGRLRPAPGFPSEWFEALIRPGFDKNERVPQKGNSDDVGLKSAYVRAKISDIQEMVGNESIPAGILPPLNRQGFVRP
jgi:hypothetical protein